MTEQILAIVWAQFRVSRNHFRRTTFGAILMWFFTAVWYAMFAGLAVLAAVSIPKLPFATLREALPIALLLLFLYNQTIPLLTLSTGWSLQINKLQVYPIRDTALFSLEVLLRITSTPEVLVVVIGGLIGLGRRPDVPLWAAPCLLLFIPLNLFLQLAAREFILHAFARNRFREIISIVFISIGIIPQVLLRTGWGVKFKPYFLLFASGKATPWQASAALSLGHSPLSNAAILAAWTALAFLLARWQFAKGLKQDDSFRVSASTQKPDKESASPLLDSIANLFHDPLATLVQKELRSLLRMPRFRVALGMACVLSTLALVPMLVFDGDHRNGFVRQNFFPLASVYALLQIADTLLLNIFGADRGAAQLYFLSPTPLSSVIKAKNIVAWLFILGINVPIAIVTSFVSHASAVTIAAGFLASAAAAIHLMWAGNLLSLMTPRPSDPNATFQNKGNSKNQLWVLACTFGMAALIGIAYLARWAFDSNWALLGTLALEFAIGCVVYFVALETAIARGTADRERIIDVLSKSNSPIGGSVG